MSRFRVIRSKGRFYVMTDTNAVAGGPFEFPDEADGAVKKLLAVEAAQAAKVAQPEAHKMNITKGYRSPDVEDGRGNAPPNIDEARLMPPGWVKWNTPNGKPLPADFVPDWKKHNIPVDPLDLPNLHMDRFGEWVNGPGTVRDVVPPAAPPPAVRDFVPPTPAPWGKPPGKPKK